MRSPREEIERLKDEEGKLATDLDRAQRAQALWGHPMLQEALGAIRADIQRSFEQLSRSGVHAPDTYQMLGQKYRCLLEFEGHLKEHMETGKIATSVLEQLQSRRRLLGDIFEGAE